MSRHLTVTDVERLYGMPASTQKLWRASGRFRENRDYTRIGRTIAYRPRALERHEGLRAYREHKKPAGAWPDIYEGETQ